MIVDSYRLACLLSPNWPCGLRGSLGCTLYRLWCPGMGTMIQYTWGGIEAWVGQKKWFIKFITLFVWICEMPVGVGHLHWQICNEQLFGTTLVLSVPSCRQWNHRQRPFCEGETWPEGRFFGDAPKQWEAHKVAVTIMMYQWGPKQAGSWLMMYQYVSVSASFANYSPQNLHFCVLACFNVDRPFLQYLLYRRVSLLHM